jgi:hypothetical protein
VACRNSLGVSHDAVGKTEVGMPHEEDAHETDK